MRRGDWLNDIFRGFENMLTEYAYSFFEVIVQPPKQAFEIGIFPTFFLK